MEAALWLRDAGASDLLPKRQQDAARKFSPYRYGHALWTYLAERFGDQVIPAVLTAKPSTSLPRRIRAATGVALDPLYADWRTEAQRRYASEPRSAAARPLLRDRSRGRLFLGPSLSPDGRTAIFFSEKDRLSLDLFVADTESGAITRKLATTAAAARFESL